MAQVSNYPISKDVYDRIFEIFLKTLVNVKNDKEAKGLVESLLTPVERIMLTKRLAIAFLLEKGYKFREIQKVIKVSLPTIAAVNIARQYSGGEGYKNVVKKILRDEKINEFLEKSIHTLISIPATGSKGGGLWRYLKGELEKDIKKNRRAF